jgi:hypothetical protein
MVRIKNDKFVVTSEDNTEGNKRVKRNEGKNREFNEMERTEGKTGREMFCFMKAI